MKIGFESAAARLEKSIIHFFSPNGLLTAVFLIVLSVLLFSGGGIERRTTDTAPEYGQAQVSPILGITR